MEILRSSLDLAYYKIVALNFFFGFSSLCIAEWETITFIEGLYGRGYYNLDLTIHTWLHFLTTPHALCQCILDAGNIIIICTKSQISKLRMSLFWNFYLFRYFLNAEFKIFLQFLKIFQFFDHFNTSQKLLKLRS